MSDKGWSFKVNCTCQHCGVAMSYTRTNENLDEQPCCPTCGEAQQSRVVEPNPMMFRRCGWGDNVSTWEEIQWRPR